MQASIPFKAGKWLDARLTLIGVWQRDKDSDFYDLPFDRRIFMGMASLNSTFILPVKPDLRLTLSGFVRSKAHQGIYDLPTSGNLDLGLRYAFAGGNCILTAWCKDIFQTAGIDPQIRYGGPLLCLEVRRLSGEEKGGGGHVAFQIGFRPFL